MEYIRRAKKIIWAWFQKDKKVLAASLCGGLLFTFIFGGITATKTYSETIQQGIADSVVRFHVLANSDSKADQALKLKVRDAVLALMNGPLTEAENIEDTKKILLESKDKIKEEALRVIEDAGYDYDVNVILSRDLFPMKEYGDIAFPAGEYDALRIEIGAAEGRNWWCVMFPPLCFVDVSLDEVSPESKMQLKHVLSEEEYSIVTNAKAGDDIVPEVKFKVVEWWQEREASGRKFATRP